eukprot:6686349-Prymnesium_polylepis.1
MLPALARRSPRDPAAGDCARHSTSFDARSRTITMMTQLLTSSRGLEEVLILADLLRHVCAAVASGDGHARSFGRLVGDAL